MNQSNKRKFKLSRLMNRSGGWRRAGMGALSCAVLALSGCGLGSSPEKPIMVFSTCSIDRPAPDFQATVGKAFNVTGWAFQKGAAQAPVKTQVQFSSADMKEIKLVDASQGQARPDVAQALNAPEAATSGYDVAVAADLLPANTYAVTIIQRYAAYSAACSYARTVSVR